VCYATSTRHESPSDVTTRATTGGRAANADASHTLRWLGKGWEVLCVTGARPSNSQQRLNAWWLVVHASSPTPCATNERETTRRPMRARVCRWKVSPTNRARGRERRRQQPRARERGRKAAERQRSSRVREEEQREQPRHESRCSRPPKTHREKWARNPILGSSAPLAVWFIVPTLAAARNSEPVRYGS